MKFTATARTLGIFSAAATVILLVAYAVTLTVGLASLESPQQPIGDPIFTILEVLIIVLMPAMVALIVAVHAWAPMQAKTLTLTSLEAAPIGGQLFAHDNSQRDCTAFRLLLDTYATRLLAQALSTRLSLLVAAKIILSEDVPMRTNPYTAVAAVHAPSCNRKR